MAEDSSMDVIGNYDAVVSRINTKAKELGREPPRLVAVSKTKPLAMICQLFEHGHRRFGENYVQELHEKSHDPGCPEGIEWHFIGHLQTNKAKMVANVPQLAMIETVSSVKLANALNKAFVAADRCMDVMVQINTSREENKHGATPEQAVDLCQHVMDNCSQLRLKGLMTIGQIGRQVPDGETNPDFESLVQCREAVLKALSIDRLELSMGMSSDFELAMQQGTDNVRVGSTIFGARNYT